ncbi:MAG: SEFIR domain-containing protein [Bacteroidota bacterium]
MSEKLKIFISYAWESDDLKQQVWKLAEWLHNNCNGCLEIEIDQLYANAPPTDGWQVWMAKQVIHSDKVLIVCTENYKKRFEKEEKNEGVGLGVHAEGSIITTQLYQNQQKNGKFFPIIPSGGDRANIPFVLTPWDSGHNFPDGKQNILKLLLGENPTFSKHKSNEAVVKEIVALKAEAEPLILQREEIVENIIALTINEKDAMLSPIHITISGFVSLSDVNKMAICKSLGLNISGFEELHPNDRDVEIIKQIKDRDLFSQLWEQIHNIKPFDSTNPFN